MLFVVFWHGSHPSIRCETAFGSLGFGQVRLFQICLVLGRAVMAVLPWSKSYVDEICVYFEFEREINVYGLILYGLAPS